jgi:hypothetical protein
MILVESIIFVSYMPIVAVNGRLLNKHKSWKEHLLDLSAELIGKASR